MSSVHWEPEFDLVSECWCSFVSIDIGLDIDCTFITLGVDFESEEFIVNEVISEEGVRLLRKVSPGFDFDALGFCHLYLN